MTIHKSPRTITTKMILIFTWLVRWRNGHVLIWRTHVKQTSLNWKILKIIFSIP